MPQHDIRICFFGDSFTNGTGDPTYLGWVGRVCARAAGRGYGVTAYNLGIRRQTSVEIAERWPDECNQRLLPGADQRLVFSFGVNDTTLEQGKPRVALADTAQAAQRILAKACSRFSILFIGPPPIADAAQNERIQEVDQVLKEVAAIYHVPYLSVFTHLAAAPIWMQQVAANDGAHPQAEGYAQMATFIDQWSGWWFYQAG